MANLAATCILNTALGISMPINKANPGYSLLLFCFVWVCFVLFCFLILCLARYDEATNELINEELGIAYPIIDGIPNMIPEAARTTQKKPPAEGSEQP
ncbi:protein hypothetical protein [Limosa lapponica baueri]|uniref:Protein preY, mitochondrial n=1 Tax=Limosa lapponica baueri TaxID=1758121 RepID=A0A2I0UIR9_LIMLA|nr:protein hypothetical protein [Limosa lapponica baueri]